MGVAAVQDDICGHGGGRPGPGGALSSVGAGVRRSQMEGKGSLEYNATSIKPLEDASKAISARGVGL